MAYSTDSALRTVLAARQGLKGFEAYAWQGLVVPAATPKPVVDPLSKALLAALDATAVKARFRRVLRWARADGLHRVGDRGG